ncbi:MAG: tetratricopeptide repeat protein [Burkholderiales bacterium]|nr:tetratricopeptide repeat protein [Burkholderiales bacterium]
MTEHPVAVGRNDPCPCGSGKRYKQCHGAIGEAPPNIVEPLSPEALTRKGIAAHEAGNLDAAERIYREVLATSPNFSAALHYLGVIFYQYRRLEEALPLLDRAVALTPREPEFHNNRGLVLAAAQRDVDAIAAYRIALSLKPEHAGALNNLGLSLHATGDVEGAIAAYRSGLALAPDFPQLHWNLALALLLQGDYAEGWSEYEWRLKAPELASSLHAFDGPRWAGDDPAGRTLLLTAEQGLGDALQNLRFARHLADRGARVVAAVPAPLRALATTAPGVTSACTADDALPPYDAHVSLMSLPGVLGITPERAAVPFPYLRVDAARRRDATAHIEREAGPALKIGVAWAGAPGYRQDSRRSMSLAAFAPLLEIPGTRWFSLKREGEALTVADAPAAARLAALDMRNDFDGLAALVDALDLVISVDTSIAHLAGALAKPVWVLLPHVPDWRWMLNRTDSPWYPTARLFRQQAPGDWTHPLHEIGIALRALTAMR